MAPSKDREKSLLRLRKRKWQLEGELKYGFYRADLYRVIDAHARLGMVPQGYFYPELLACDERPAELTQVLRNKPNTMADNSL